MCCVQTRRVVIIIVKFYFVITKPRRGDIFLNLKLFTMPGTFSQIYIQIVFAVKGRDNLIANSWKTELHKYIAGIIKGKGEKPLL